MAALTRGRVVTPATIIGLSSATRNSGMRPSDCSPLNPIPTGSDPLSLSAEAHENDGDNLHSSQRVLVIETDTLSQQTKFTLVDRSVLMAAFRYFSITRHPFSFGFKLGSTIVTVLAINSYTQSLFYSKFFGFGPVTTGSIIAASGFCSTITTFLTRIVFCASRDDGFLALHPLNQEQRALYDDLMRLAPVIREFNHLEKYLVVPEKLLNNDANRAAVNQLAVYVFLKFKILDKIHLVTENETLPHTTKTLSDLYAQSHSDRLAAEQSPQGLLILGQLALRHFPERTNFWGNYAVLTAGYDCKDWAFAHPVWHALRHPVNHYLALQQPDVTVSQRAILRRHLLSPSEWWQTIKSFLRFTFIDSGLTTQVFFSCVSSSTNILLYLGFFNRLNRADNKSLEFAGVLRFLIYTLIYLPSCFRVIVNNKMKLSKILQNRESQKARRRYGLQTASRRWYSWILPGLLASLPTAIYLLVTIATTLFFTGNGVAEFASHIGDIFRTLLDEHTNGDDDPCAKDTSQIATLLFMLATVIAITGNSFVTLMTNGKTFLESADNLLNRIHHCLYRRVPRNISYSSLSSSSSSHFIHQADNTSYDCVTEHITPRLFRWLKKIEPISKTALWWDTMQFAVTSAYAVNDMLDQNSSIANHLMMALYLSVTDVITGGSSRTSMIISLVVLACVICLSLPWMSSNNDRGVKFVHNMNSYFRDPSVLERGDRLTLGSSNPTGVIIEQTRELESDADQRTRSSFA